MSSLTPAGFLVKIYREPHHDSWKSCYEDGPNATVISPSTARDVRNVEIKTATDTANEIAAENSKSYEWNHASPKR